MHVPTLSLAGALDPRQGWAADRCNLARAVEAVGSRSAFLLMREAFYGTTRFDDFAERAGISQPVAAARLRELVQEGLLVRQPYREPGRRTRMEYRLSDKGADLFTALAALMQWGDRWLGPAPVELRHHGCGEPVHVQLRCTKGHRPALSDVDLIESASS
ncbi:MAG TPA: helix-turn-helix domain-containing protein [Kineosporiaceae bacterium]|jgi:DNA-binding HxlR family transcriptional regulator|nr:helix-turn-helix domain-containing protein [Kineosporiaceae bacterium]